MGQSPSWEADSLSATPEIRLLRKSDVYYHVHQPPQDPILGHMDPVHVRLSCFIITFIIILSSTPSLQRGLISSGFTEEMFYEICPLVEFYAV